jgi:hypothetical protein
MEFYTRLIIARSKGKSIGKESERRGPAGKIRVLAIGRGVEGDVDDGFELDGEALFGGGAEFPLA